MVIPAVIDAHHHFWDPARRGSPWRELQAPPLRRPYGPDELAPELEAAAIAGSVLVAAERSLAETAHLLATAARVAFVRGVVGWIDLETATVEADIGALRWGAGGDALVGLCLRAHDPAEIARLGQATLRDALRSAAAAGLVVDLDLRPAAMAAAIELCAALPRVTFVLDHLARPPIASGDLSDWGGALLELAELPNVSAKLSGLVIEADWHTWSIDDLRHPVQLAVDAFGSHRLMLGSAWPVSLVAGSLIDVIDSVNYLIADLSPGEQDEIGGGTAVRVYGLPGPGPFGLGA